MAGIESDAGAARPLGFNVEGPPETLDAVRKLAAPLGHLGADRIRAGHSGVDLIPLVDAGVPGIGLQPDGTHYFDLHHTAADTFDKIDRMDLALQVAAMALMTWQVAEAPDALPAKRPQAR